MSQRYSLKDFLREVASFITDPDLANRVVISSESSRLDEDLAFDSVSLVEIQMGFEELHSLELTCKDINKCVTIGDILMLVTRSLVAVS